MEPIKPFTVMVIGLISGIFPIAIIAFFFWILAIIATLDK